MLLTELLEAIEALGIELISTETEIRYKPVDALPEHLKAELIAHKAQLLQPRTPTLMAQFKAAVANFNRLLEEEAALSERIVNGQAFCKAHPRDKEAMRLLSELIRQRDKARQGQEWEAVQQADLETAILRERGLSRGMICAICFDVVEGCCQKCWPVIEVEEVAA